MQPDSNDNADWVNALDRVTSFHRLPYPKGMKTGFPCLDSLSGGRITPGSVTVLAGEPHESISALAGCIARNMALGQTEDKLKRRIGVFSLDLTRDEYVSSMVCAFAGVSKFACCDGFVSTTNSIKLKSAAEMLRTAKIFIDDTCIIDGPKLIEKAEAMKAAHDIDLLIIDKFPLIEGGFSVNEDTYYGKRNHKRQIAIAIRRMAKKLDVAVIIVTDAFLGDTDEETLKRIGQLSMENHKVIAFPYVGCNRLADNVWLLERPCRGTSHPEAGNMALALIHTGDNNTVRLKVNISGESYSNYEEIPVSDGGVTHAENSPEAPK